MGGSAGGGLMRVRGLGVAKVPHIFPLLPLFCPEVGGIELSPNRQRSVRGSSDMHASSGVSCTFSAFCLLESLLEQAFQNWTGNRVGFDPASQPGGRFFRGCLEPGRGHRLGDR